MKKGLQRLVGRDEPNSAPDENSRLLVLNAGSSSIKFALYKIDTDNRPVIDVTGEIDGIGATPKFSVKNDGKEELHRHSFSCEEVPRHAEAIKIVGLWMRDYCRDKNLLGVGHRIVHGGRNFLEPILLNPVVISQLDALVPLAPLHQPQQIAVIRAFSDALPSLPQVACFDTACHHTQPAVAPMFAVPRRLTKEGVCRYGFHGLSYEYIASSLPGVASEIADGRIITAHLGNGASLCAMQHRRSIATTMSFTPLDGLVMGTRCGSLDPGVLLYLMDQHKMDARALEKLLYHESGLKGVSGISGDMRCLLSSDTPEAQEAIDLFIYRIKREIGSLVAALGGLDALIFTGGIGERSAIIRTHICREAAWLGIELDPAANERHGPCISSPGSRVSVWVVPTDENLIIAQHTLKQLAKETLPKTNRESRSGKNENNDSRVLDTATATLHELNH